MFQQRCRIAELLRRATILAAVLSTPMPCVAAEDEVSEIKAVHRSGQTFVTWKDVAAGEAGAKYRYSLYRGTEPITTGNWERAELCYRGVLNNSAKLYGAAFTQKDRLDPGKPYVQLDPDGSPLPPWSGLAVHTARRTGAAYYAVLATDEMYNVVGKIIPGRNATIDAVTERPSPIQPLKLYDSRERTGPYVASTCITGKRGLPLHLTLHGSQSNGGGAGEYGDYYLFFGTPEMGFRDGLAGVFSVQELHAKEGNRLLLRVRDAVEHPSGKRAMETYWFGYYCTPQGADHSEPRVYPFTAEQLLWITDWVVEHYGVDRERVTVGGSSSGGVGSWNFGLRHPERFAAVYPIIGRVRRVPAIPLEGKLERDNAALMADGKTTYYDYLDGPKFVTEHAADLSFVGWSCGRNDGYATWQENIDMVKAMTAEHHGFAFSWNNGGHGEGGRAMTLINKYYPVEKFAHNLSYPAFGNSSIDQKMGNGDPLDGDLVGGINLGFSWDQVVDEPDRWSVSLTNDLAQQEMTVDVTPRRCRQFKVPPGKQVHWQSSLGETGKATADAAGLITIRQVKLRPRAAALLTLQFQ